MPLNLLKKYNEHLDIGGLGERERRQSLMRVFNRDIADNPAFTFRGKKISPTPADGAVKMETLYSHLTTVIVDKATRKREFEFDRSCRLHWVKYHIDQSKANNVIVFSVDEPEGIRTYIYDIDEKYVVILEPLKNKSEYYLLTAYYLTGKDAQRDKIMRKFGRKLPEIY